MRIIHIVRANAIAGAENHIFMLLKGLKTLGCEVALLTITDNVKENITTGYGKKLLEMEQQGIIVYREMVRGKLDFTAVIRIGKIIRKFNPAVVHTHMPYADLFGAIAAKFSGIKIVVASRHYDYSINQLEIKKFKWYYKLANFFINYTITVSGCVEQLCRDIEGIKEYKLRTIYHGYEEEQLDKGNARKEVAIELNLDGQFLFGTVARLIDLKGHQYAIEAMRYLDAKGISYKWIFVGEGPMRQELEEMALREGVEKSLLFLGHREDIPRLMAAMDIMVHPTTGEGFGLVFLEAMSQSTAIIATNTGAVPEIIVDGQTGFIVENKNGQSIAEGIMKIIEKKETIEVMGQKGRQYLEEKFSLDKMCMEIIKVYEKCLKES